MFKNLITHSLRSFKRQRSYIIINVLGLSIGIACSLFIALYVLNEISYDKFNTKKDRIYRVILSANVGGGEMNIYANPSVLGPTLLKEFPEVDGFLRMNNPGIREIKCNNQTFNEDHLVEADSSFFNFFSIRILKGNPENLLNAPHRIVLSESTARKLFGKENPVDKPLK